MGPNNLVLAPCQPVAFAFSLLLNFFRSLFWLFQSIVLRRVVTTRACKFTEACPTLNTPARLCTAALATVVSPSQRFYERPRVLRSPVFVLRVFEDDSVKGVGGPGNHGKYARHEDHLVKQAFCGAEGKAGDLLKPVITQGRQDEGQEGATAAKLRRARETGKRGCSPQVSIQPVQKYTRGRTPSFENIAERGVAPLILEQPRQGRNYVAACPPPANHTGNSRQ